MSIKIDNVSKKFNEYYAIKNVSLELEYGKIYCLIGDSGSGKTTLLKMISGLLKPTEGSITYDGIDIYKLDSKSLSKHRNENVGFIFQNFFLDENLSVYENTVVPLLIRRDYDKDKILNTVYKALNTVGLTEKVKQTAKTLSGGEKQRVSIARAIVGNPKIVFADEPTGNLDSTNSKKIIDTLRCLNQNGTTVLIVTHNENIAKLINDKIHIKDGSIVGTS